MYAFALRPRWLLSHLLVAALIAAMIGAMFWQFDRLGQRQDRNARIAARTDVGVVSLDQLVTSNFPEADIDSLEFRRVAASGTFVRSEEVLVRNRSLNGAPGTWALTPLVLSDGRAIAVNRGWLPAAIKPEDDRAEVDPPSGSVTVTGYLRLTEVASGFQVADPADGQLISMARPDLARFDEQVDATLLPVWLQLESLSGPTGERGLPAPLELPPLSDGPHRGYAMQWAIFSLIGLIGYPMIIRRVATSRAKDRAVAASVERARVADGRSDFESAAGNFDDRRSHHDDE